MSSTVGHIEMAKGHLKPYVFLKSNHWQSKDWADLFRDGTAIVAGNLEWFELWFMRFSMGVQVITATGLCLYTTFLDRVASGPS